MAKVALAYRIELEGVECAGCGAVFGMSPLLNNEMRRSHETFYCPIGHRNHYPGESDEERAKRLLREEQARHQRTLERANTAEQARLESERRHERLQKRVKAGTCPYCKRTFSQLQRHMACKHPGATP